MPKRNFAVSSAKTLFAFVVLFGSLSLGCTPSDPAPKSAAAAASEADDESKQSRPNFAAAGLGASSGDAERIDGFPGEQIGVPDGAADPMLPGADGYALAESTPVPAGVPEGGVGGRPLRENLTAEQLMQVLENSDRDMQTIASGRGQYSDAQEASEMMHAIAKIKLQAAIQIQTHPDATPPQRIDGMRGQLQSLSHLAAMGDVASARALESLAKENLTATEATIAGDSRIVLVGFAIDALQAGRESAADEIVSLIDGMVENPNSDVPSVLIMARARQILSSYGLVDQAAKVREKILALYGGSSNAMIAQVAADAAGTAKFDVASRLLTAILESDNVALERWSDAVMELLADSPEMNTVQFLASSALQLEAAGRDAFVEETFSILTEQFTDLESATATEIQTAKEAMEARRKVIGSSFGLEDLPSVDGNGISPKDYQDKIVLMPFWAISIPESLQMVSMLKQIRDAHPEKIVIVGMNLDPEQAPLREFLAERDMGFASYRSMSSATASVANPVAARFGLVSLPFVAIFNQQGKVEALDFTGNRLNSIVDRLIATED